MYSKNESILDFKEKYKFVCFFVFLFLFFFFKKLNQVIFFFFFFFFLKVETDQPGSRVRKLPVYTTHV